MNKNDRRSVAHALKKAAGIMLWLLIVFTLTTEVVFSQVEALPNQAPANADEIGLGGFFFGYVLFPILLLLHRTFIVWRVKRSMYGTSGQEQPEQPGVFDRSEHPAGVIPEFIEYDAGTVIPEIVAYREQLVSCALGAYRQRWHYALVSALLYCAIPWLFAWVAGETLNDGHIGILFIAVIYAVLTSLSYAFNKSEFMAYGHDRGWVPNVYGWLISVFIKMWLKPLSGLMLWLILAAGMGLFFYVDIIEKGGTLKSVESPAFVTGLCLALGLHLLLLIKDTRSVIDAPNIKLLVLRVFGKAGGAKLTFTKLVEVWRYFGLHFTVDDPNFAKHRYRFFQWRTLIAFLAIVILGSVHFMFAVVIFVAIVAWDWAGLLTRQPVKNTAEVCRRMEKVIARPRSIDGRFRDTRMVCHMDTWKLVVEQFINTADVVLFDLREFSMKNSGSKYEINFLFDTYPVSSIVFLRDVKSDSEVIYDVILEQWRELREGSPNWSIQEPLIQVYVSNKQNADDVQGLMDLLLAVAKAESGQEQPA